MVESFLDKFLNQSEEEKKEFVNILMKELGLNKTCKMSNAIPKKYDEKIINGLELIVLDYNEKAKEITYTTKDVLSGDLIKKYFTDKWYLCDWDERYVRFNSNIRDNKFENSYIYGVLNEEFKDNELKGLNVVGDVRLLTKGEVETLDDEHRILENSYWTMTPYEDCEKLENGGYAGVFVAYSPGCLSWYTVVRTYGVRPVFTLVTE